MVETSIRFRVMLEPRGFIKVIEFVLAIVAFGTTGGYNSQMELSLKCTGAEEVKIFHLPVSYPFNFESEEVTVWTCNKTSYVPVKTTLEGDFSPTSQWFMFVGVMAFLICLAGVVFYVAFETNIRAKNENLVTVGDLAVTVLWTFLWLTAAASWAWGVNQVKAYGGKAISQAPMKDECAENQCSYLSDPDYGPLNASVAFAFLSVLVWAGNVWFVYKETPYHDDQATLTPNEGVPSQEVPSNQN
uniref:synaptophysin-like protein 2 n=1 Tax=Styela clava TaxID=7725 RepID=UPI001939FE79|nr:synaptophysin-like protein 2 [Styela clava]